MKKTRLIVLGFMSLLMISGCGKDEEPGDQFTGTIQSIEEFLTPELIEIMTELDMEFNTGNTPPNIEGEYLTSPILEATNVPGDAIGSSFWNAALKFEEQDNENLSVKFSYDQTIESGEGIGALIAGKGELFSVLLKVSGEHDSSPINSAMVISGRMASQGIADVQWAIFMLENYGATNVIENGQGRIFVDSDNLAEKIIANGKLQSVGSSGNKSLMGR